MGTYLLGVDIGTSGCKATVIDTNGRFIADGYTEYPSYHPHFGWVEQKSTDWLNAMILSLKRAAEKGKFSTKDIIGLAVDASAHNTVLLDRNGAVIRDTIMWQDQRAYQEAAFLKERYLDLIKSTTFSSPSATWSLPQLMWVRDNEPEVYSKIERIMFIDDYVRYQLTGAISTTHIQAQGSLMFDNRKMVWSEDLVKLTGLPMTVLPEIRKTTDISGYVTAKAAALTGLKEGIPVVMGASDTSLESYSVGGSSPVTVCSRWQQPAASTFSAILERRFWTLSYIPMWWTAFGITEEGRFLQPRHCAGTGIRSAKKNSRKKLPEDKIHTSFWIRKRKGSLRGRTGSFSTRTCPESGLHTGIQSSALRLPVFPPCIGGDILIGLCWRALHFLCASALKAWRNLAASIRFRLLAAGQSLPFGEASSQMCLTEKS